MGISAATIPMTPQAAHRRMAVLLDLAIVVVQLPLSCARKNQCSMSREDLGGPHGAVRDAIRLCEGFQHEHALCQFCILPDEDD
jgi:hypothetical protein